MRSTATLVLLLLTLAAAPTAARATDASRGGSMPDSVLARIGARREVTLAAFRDAWRQAAQSTRPDRLTPQAARRFLELLCGREALAELALGDPPAWTPADSAAFDALRDRLTLRAVLDSVLADARARMIAAGDSTSDPQAPGIAARDSLLARLRPAWDPAALERLAVAFRALPRPSADSSVSAQLRLLAVPPRLGPGEDTLTLARTNEGAVSAGHLLAWWSRLDPVRRPRIETAAQVGDLVADAMFETVLRREVTRHDLTRRPDIAADLEDERLTIAVRHRVEREVFERLDRSESALRRHHQQHAAEYALPLRARVVRLVVPGLEGATSMALRLRDDAQAESLMVRAARRGVRYEGELSAGSDSALFARVLRSGPGTVLGPDPVEGGWQVVRVRGIVPARLLPYAEVRDQVEREWVDLESARLTHEMLDRSRRAVPVRINQRALAGLTGP